ncbi:ankyrin repeat domain-containing protein [Variovorax terrae]|uniref:Ankyrin repeat domain-containing protein n=1 Tax=Variovorax terrae TaxID=2923278 RepID=A0A9X1VZH1_9BURK|nr:ankyrin repeat domain-containing protein [Variovorax terrae]MCJ0763313.1 ankyrin repeat domain-containing protein [Variovorax terrae]
MRNYFKNLIYLIVLIGFNVCHAGSYEDFFVAIKQDNAAAMTRLLQRGFDPNTPDPKGQNGLYLALREPSLKVAQVLIDWPKTDVDVLNAQGESPLMIAALKGQLDIARKLIERDASVNKTGWAPLHYAATNSHLDVMRLLLDNSAYIDAASPNGTTPLMMAAFYGSASAVKLLLEEGADPLLKNQQDLSAIDFAQRANRKESADIIAAFVRGRQPKGKW